MATEQETECEPVVLEAWRARLCARGLRDAYDRMRRAMLAGNLDLRQALAIAQSMDAAVDMLRETTKRLAPGTALRKAAEDTMAAFIEWRVASPRTDASRRAAARFGARVMALEEAAKGASHREGAETQDESPAGSRDAGPHEVAPAGAAIDEAPLDARELERASRANKRAQAATPPKPATPPKAAEPRRGPSEQRSGSPSSSRKRGRSRDRA